MVAACDPKLMPTFPQHRNLKASKTNSQTAVASAANTSNQEGNNNSGDHSLHLPAISDLVSADKDFDFHVW